MSPQMLCVAALAMCALLFFLGLSPDTDTHGDGRPSPADHRRRMKMKPLSVTIMPHELYKSQDGQDKWADEHVFHGQTAGVFVDLGCYDGVTYSNTWYFERVLNWTGVCAEPNPEVYPRIAGQAGRSSGVQVAVSDHEGTAPFVAAYMRSSLNATAVDYAFLAQQGVQAETVDVRLTTPSALLAAHLPAGTVIDYVNIDVEQLELAILRVWPWASYCVRVFNIENEPPAGSPSLLPQIDALLAPRGYAHAGRLGVDELFTRTTPCVRSQHAPLTTIESSSSSPRGRVGARGNASARRRAATNRRLSRSKAKLHDLDELRGASGRGP